MPDGGVGGSGRGGWPRRVAVVAGHTGCRGPLRAAEVRSLIELCG